MISVATKYQGESSMVSGTLGLSTNEVRPVRFWGKISEDTFALRRALQTLGQLVWSDFQWLSDAEYEQKMELVLDPIITVHDDRIFFEAFNQDQSAYGMVIADRSMFESKGKVVSGTTNIDFTESLYKALSKMRSNKESWFKIGPGGLAVKTGKAPSHVEEKVEIPVPWVRGFLQLQSAMALPGTRVDLRPVEVLNILRWVKEHRAEHSPRSLRFEFEPGQNTRVVLEPWEKTIELKNATHRYTQKKVTRIWGRQRLALLEPILPHADSVSLYLKGRALPSFWTVKVGKVTFVLGMSGWTGNNWTQAGSFDLMNPKIVCPKSLEKVVDILRKIQCGDAEDIAGETGLDTKEAFAALSELCRQGRAIYDIESQKFRHRELFAEPIDLDTYYPPDPRVLESLELQKEEKIKILQDEMSSTKKAGSIFYDRKISGEVADHLSEVVIKDTGQMVFGKCTCDFFKENLMALGPCAHMIALREVADRDEFTEKIFADSDEATKQAKKLIKQKVGKGYVEVDVDNF